MAREVVTGYCWPQSVAAGGSVDLHLSSSGGRPVRVEVARVGAERVVVWRDGSVSADEHETPKDASASGCGWPAATTIDVDPAWRSGYYEVVLEIDVGEKVRRDHAFFVVRPPAGTRIVLALATNTWHAYNDFGGRNLYNGGTRVAMQRPMARGYLFKPPGKGRRVTGTGEADPQNAAHVGYLQLNHLSGWAGSAGWPDWEQPFLAWAERHGFDVGVCTNADLEHHPEVLDGAEPSAGASGQVDLVVDDEAGYVLSLVFSANVQLALVVDFVTVVGEDGFGHSDGEGGGEAVVVATFGRVKRFGIPGKRASGLVRLVGAEGEGDVVGVAGVAGTDALGEAGEAGVHLIVDEVAQARAGRRALRQSALPGAEFDQQVARAAVPADGAAVAFDPCGAG